MVHIIVILFGADRLGAILSYFKDSDEMWIYYEHFICIEQMTQHILMWPI